MKKLFEFIMAMVYGCGAAMAVALVIVLFARVFLNAK